ncbi:MAG: hypothetical protein GY853_16160 [PVC group bacterium]|nr:hypothetical protein [PVC group bacterium]
MIDCYKCIHHEVYLSSKAHNRTMITNIKYPEDYFFWCEWHERRLDVDEIVCEGYSSYAEMIKRKNNE